MSCTLPIVARACGVNTATCVMYITHCGTCLWCKYSNMCHVHYPLWHMPVVKIQQHVSCTLPIVARACGVNTATCVMYITHCGACLWCKYSNMCHVHYPLWHMPVVKIQQHVSCTVSMHCGACLWCKYSNMCHVQ